MNSLFRVVLVIVFFGLSGCSNHGAREDDGFNKYQLLQGTELVYEMTEELSSKEWRWLVKYEDKKFYYLVKAESSWNIYFFKVSKEDILIDYDNRHLPSELKPEGVRFLMPK
ncbi:MAG: hypothetical protein OEM38_09545 [Gammaproteobacteria bacterium]|nr:hypothetical protein [Gammaproteobacteria bacterium]